MQIMLFIQKALSGNPQTKKCKDCKESFPLDCFGDSGNGYKKSYCRDCASKRSSKWNKENNTRYRKNLKSFYDKNPDYRYENHKEWCENNRDRISEYGKERWIKVGRRFRKHKIGLISRFGPFCQFCKKIDSWDDQLQVDHIHPLAKEDSYIGDINEFENAQLLCKTCNVKKYDRMIPSFQNRNLWFRLYVK